MNRERVKELLPVMKAFAEGKTIEVRPSRLEDPSAWRVAGDPKWYSDHDYRVKREPKRIWIPLPPDPPAIYTTKPSFVHTIEFVEVIND